MYLLVAFPIFKKNYVTYSRDRSIKKKIDKALLLLEQNPQYPSLQSHKVESLRFGIKWTSWVPGDLRIIWEYDQNEVKVLNILDLGAHSGNKKVYK